MIMFRKGKYATFHLAVSGILSTFTANPKNKEP